MGHVNGKWLASLGLAVCLVAGASLRGSGQGVTVSPQTGTADWAAVVAAAKKEGAVTMYTNPGMNAEFEAAAASFQKLYGIEVTLSYADGATNTQKVLIEAQTGHVKGDVYSAGLGPLNTLAKAGYAIALDPPNQSNIVSTFDVLKGATPLFVNVYGILVNTTKLAGMPMPASWADLVKPALAGKMVMQDPRVDGGGGTFFISSYDRLGQTFEQKLAALHPTINGAGGGNAAEEAVARGDYVVMIAGRAHALQAYPQAPLKWIAPAEGSVVVPIAMTMVKGAPHPNAARVWANYLLQPEFQSSLSTTVLPVIKNATIKNPLFRVKLKFLEVLPPSQDRTKYYADAKQLYGEQ
jgi:ABC-type Fe3+ transport system substrate-binding protein